ncbi:MAG TPA: hypothetical protein DCM08_10710 [Microscillaceae bacterium]|nr:hypothetical protein [Microscillaceae bacterium]
MENLGYIEIKISGSKGNLELSSENYDIRDIISILENAESLLNPDANKNRPTISYSIESGSVRHILKTTIQYIIGFNAIIGQINQNQTIDFLEPSTAKAFEFFQNIASKSNYQFTIKTSLDSSNEVRLDRTTNFKRKEAVWVEAEFYFYGKITNAGGKDKANIHVNTENLGLITINTPISFLEEYQDNLLYKTLGIRAVGKQNSETGEIDTSTLQFVQLIDYEQKYDSDYLSDLRDKAKKNWLSKINADSWLKEIRGGYDA